MPNPIETVANFLQPTSRFSRIDDYSCSSFERRKFRNRPTSVLPKLPYRYGISKVWYQRQVFLGGPQQIYCKSIDPALTE